MPLGLNQTDLNASGTSYKDGTPITTPHEFGNAITTPHNFGNPIPTSGTEQNLVTWAPSPSHFGNIIGGNSTSGFLLEDASGVILLEDGSILLLEVQ